jgi:hypothetical protein
MRFKTKDLMVSVTPKAEVAEADLAKVCALYTHICFSPTWCFNQTGLPPDLGPPCPPCSLTPSLGACGPCSFGPTCLPCSGYYTWGYYTWQCPESTANVACAVSRPEFVPTLLRIISPEDIGTLRAELRKTQAKLDEIEQAGLMGIQTLAEAEAYEAGLKEALQQVQAAKKNLQ